MASGVERKNMLDRSTKDKLIKKFRIHESDTGSSNIQIAILSHEIQLLSDHLKTHRKDFSSRRGLVRKVNERRKLLNYLRKTDPNSFVELSKKLKLKLTFGDREKEEEPVATAAVENKEESAKK